MRLLFKYLSFCLILPLMGNLAVGQINPQPLTPIWEQALADSFSGVVLVAEKGTVQFVKANGWANPAQTVPLTEANRFGIASMTKSFTAVLIMQMVEAGTLRLDQTLAELLPAYPIAKAQKITLKNLLLHTSGLPNELDDRYAQAMAAPALLGSVLTPKAKYRKPGRFNYNNMDYLLLGEILAEQSGKSWFELLQAQILEPLGMQETGMRSQDMPKGQVVTGFMRAPAGQLVPEPPFHIENFGAAGALYSTVGDLLRYDQAFYGDQLLSQASQDLLFESHPELGYVSMGHWTYRYPFLPTKPLLVERRGGILGFQCVFVRFIEQQQTIIILSNADTFNPDSFGDAANLKEALIRVVGASGE